MNRRELIQALLGSSAALLVSGCGRPQLPSRGRLLAPNLKLGHRLRDGFLPEPTGERRRTHVAIIGGGVAGLSAAWRLARSGVDDFVVFELEERPGGTAAFGTDGITAYPWGAHYIPVPLRENQALIALLQEMRTIEGVDEEGNAIVGEQFLCRDPGERLYFAGAWHRGLYPYEGASDRDLSQLKAFREEIDGWVARRDSDGRRMFAIPMAAGSKDGEVTDLDQFSMADWMDQHGWDSPRLRWLVDYACRDDYGLRLGQTSAWAGVFYFASRMAQPGDDSQPVITWPEGNGRVVQHLVEKCGSRMFCGHGVCRITPAMPGSPESQAELTIWDGERKQAIGIDADHVIFAAPQFLAKHLIKDFEARTKRTTADFQYGGWVVANLHLKGRPRERGFPLSWDNVIYDSPSLGYVVATHQLGIDHGPTVLTWYYPLAGASPSLERKELLSLTWEDWADTALTDIERAHADIRDLTVRLDVMRWGHAMIQPRPGFVWGAAREQAALPDANIHFACTDLSGMALFEEAFYHGVRAAEQVLKNGRHSYASMLST